MCPKRMPLVDAKGRVVTMNYKGKEITGLLAEVSDKNPRIMTGRLMRIPEIEGSTNTYFDIDWDSKNSPLCTVMAKTKVSQAIKASTLTFEQMLQTISLSGCTIGTDPEIFVVDKKGIVIPAFLFLPSKKEADIFWDGFQAEFRTTPMGCLAFLTDNVRNQLNKLISLAKAKFPDAKLTYQCVMEIPTSLMSKADKAHVELGCAPSKNVYDWIEPVHVEDPYTLPIRFAGCHLHFSMPGAIEFKEKVIKKMDSICGVMSVSLFQEMEDRRRRLFYGRAGEFRTPTHGLEWRTLSSAVLTHPVLFHLCVDVSRACYYLTNTLVYPHWEVKEQEIVETINYCDVSAAKKILTKNEKFFRALLSRIYPRVSADKKFQDSLWDLVCKGAKEHFNINSIEDNWHLGTSKWITHSGSSNCQVDKWKV